MSILDFLKRPPPTSADIRTQLAKLQSELPQLDEAVLTAFDTGDNGPEFSAAIGDRAAQRERIKILSELLPEIEARERRAEEKAQAAAAAEERRLQIKRFEKTGAELLRTAELLRRNAKAVLEGIRDLDRMAEELRLSWTINGNGYSPKEFVERTLAAPAWLPFTSDFVALAAARLEAARKANFDPDPIPERPTPIRYPETVIMGPEAMSLGWGHHWPLHRELLAPTVQQPLSGAGYTAHSIYDDRDPQKPPQKLPGEPIASDHYEAAQSETPQPAIASADLSGTVAELPGQGTDSPSYLAELQENIGELRRLGVQIDAPA